MSSNTILPLAITADRIAFYSDGHIGHKRARVDDLLLNLQAIEAPVKILNGDMLDFDELPIARQLWQEPQFLVHFAKNLDYYLPGAHAAVWREIQRQAADGVRFYYEPGNHDRGLRDHAGTSFLGTTITREPTITLPDGRQALIVHGDQFDASWCRPTFTQKLGDKIYTSLIGINHRWNSWRQQRLLPPQEISAQLKHGFKAALAHMNNFDARIIQYLQSRPDAACDVVVCGHIHRERIDHFFLPCMKTGALRDITYVNCGDNLESANVVVADVNGVTTYARPRWKVTAHRIVPGELHPTFQQMLSHGRAPIIHQAGRLQTVRRAEMAAALQKVA